MALSLKFNPFKEKDCNLAGNNFMGLIFEEKVFSVKYLIFNWFSLTYMSKLWPRTVVG